MIWLRPTAFTRSAAAIAWGALGGWLMSVCVARAGVPESEGLPPLLPPHGEIPPTFWETHSWQLVGGVIFFLAALSALLWWWMRPKPPLVIPPATRARSALHSLETEPETGPVLTRVSQAVRGYFASVFGLPSGELTTGEFARAASAADRPSPELASAVDLLRACDERKFAPAPPIEPLGVVSQALQLIDRAEARIEQNKLRQGQEAPVAPGPAAGPPSA